MPTAEFQREHYADRPWALDLVSATADPERSFDRWMQRDALFAVRITSKLGDTGAPF